MDFLAFPKIPKDKQITSTIAGEEESVASLEELSSIAKLNASNSEQSAKISVESRKAARTAKAKH